MIVLQTCLHFTFMQQKAKLLDYSCEINLSLFPLFFFFTPINDSFSLQGDNIHGKHNFIVLHQLKSNHTVKKTDIL